MNTPKTIIDAFCEQYIEQLHEVNQLIYGNVKPQYSITWKNMNFIWKKFISNLGIPNVMFYNTIKNMMKERFEYDENEDAFNNVTSKYLPVVSEFIRFWDDSIVYEANVVIDASLQIASQQSPLCSPIDYYMLNNYNVSANEHMDEFTNELEIDEILVLFKHWCKTNISSISTFYELIL